MRMRRESSPETKEETGERKKLYITLPVNNAVRSSYLIRVSQTLPVAQVKPTNKLVHIPVRPLTPYVTSYSLNLIKNCFQQYFRRGSSRTFVKTDQARWTLFPGSLGNQPSFFFLSLRVFMSLFFICSR